ncbi:MAG: hypothetical protein AAGJ82_03755 [Bacteroidota bacterium]
MDLRTNLLFILLCCLLALPAAGQVEWDISFEPKMSRRVDVLETATDLWVLYENFILRADLTTEELFSYDYTDIDYLQGDYTDLCPFADMWQHPSGDIYFFLRNNQYFRYSNGQFLDVAEQLRAPGHNIIGTLPDGRVLIRDQTIVYVWEWGDDFYEQYPFEGFDSFFKNGLSWRGGLNFWCTKRNNLDTEYLLSLDAATGQLDTIAMPEPHPNQEPEEYPWLWSEIVSTADGGIWMFNQGYLYLYQNEAWHYLATPFYDPSDGYPTVYTTLRTSLITEINKQLQRVWLDEETNELRTEDFSSILGVAPDEGINFLHLDTRGSYWFISKFYPNRLQRTSPGQLPQNKGIIPAVPKLFLTEVGNTAGQLWGLNYTGAYVEAANNEWFNIKNIYPHFVSYPLDLAFTEDMTPLTTHVQQNSFTLSAVGAEGSLTISALGDTTAILPFTYRSVQTDYFQHVWATNPTLLSTWREGSRHDLIPVDFSPAPGSFYSLVFSPTDPDQFYVITNIGVFACDGLLNKRYLDRTYWQLETGSFGQMGLQIAEDGTLWYADKMTVKYLKNDIVRALPTLTVPWPTGRVYIQDILVLSDEDIWVNINGAGYGIAHWDGQDWTQVNYANSPILGNGIRSLQHRPQQQTLLAESPHGLYTIALTEDAGGASEPPTPHISPNPGGCCLFSLGWEQVAAGRTTVDL